MHLFNPHSLLHRGAALAAGCAALLLCSCVSTPLPSGGSAKKVLFSADILDEAQQASAAAFRARNVNVADTYWKDELSFLPCGFSRGEDLGIQIRESDLVSLLGRPADLLDDPDGTRRMLYPLSKTTTGNTTVTEFMVVMLHRDLTCRCLFEERQQVSP